MTTVLNNPTVSDLKTLPSSITNVKIRGGLTLEHIKVLADSTTITTLDISWNNVGPKGAAHLAKNTTITTLEIRNNNVGPEGVAQLAKRMELNKGICQDILDLL